MKIIIDSYIPYIKGALDDVAEVVYLSHKQMTPDIVKDADALIVRTRTRCNEQLLHGSAVKFIASATIGYDHIDADYCRANNIKWTNAPGCNALSVAQYMSSALCLLAEKNNFDLRDKTIGIVGVGAVGSKIAKLCESFGMKVLLNDPPRVRKEKLTGFSSLSDICNEADIITFHTLLSTSGEDKTFHLADANFFDNLKNKPIIINASRGEVIDTTALIHAIDTQKVGDVILDVWENEPDIHLDLLHKTLIATPHIAGYSADGKANAAMQSVRSVSRHFGLNKDSWQPIELPDPLSIDFECETSISCFFQETYEIEADSMRLKFSPETFERQRSNYPFRREPKAYIKQMSEKFKANFMAQFGLFFE